MGVPPFSSSTFAMSITKDLPVEMTPKKDTQTPKKRKRQEAVKHEAVKQTQLESFFPIRRSNRQEQQKHTPKLRCEQNVFQSATEYKEVLQEDSMEKQGERLEAYDCTLKGRGVRSRYDVAAGHFICEYKGELLTDEEEVNR